MSGDPTDEQAIARLQCLACGDWLAPAASLGGVLPPERRQDLFCLGCRTPILRHGGVFDFGGASARIVRRFRLGKKDQTFQGLLDSTLRMARNSDRTIEDETYALLSWLDLSPAQAVLLLGCGEGRLLGPISRTIDPGVLIAVESDPQQLRDAEQRRVTDELHNVVLIHGDLANPPIRPGSVDRLMMMGVLHGSDEPIDLTRRVGGTLRDEGVLVGMTLARSILPKIATQQERFGKAMGVRFLDANQFGRDLCRSGFSEFQMDQASNWTARFLARRTLRNGR